MKSTHAGSKHNIRVRGFVIYINVNTHTDEDERVLWKKNVMDKIHLNY